MGVVDTRRQGPFRTSIDEQGRAADYGFFGPDSVTWKVWSYPTSVIYGFIRAVTIQHLDPFLAASVVDSGQVTKRPAVRYDRTMQYFATVAFGDAESVLKASDVLMKIHERSVGTEPVTGRGYDANDPDSQLWIHVTAWHSILYCYEKFGPGKLTPAEEDRYWEECAIAADFQPIDPATVPRNRAEVRRYFEDYRKRMVVTEDAQAMMEFLLDIGGGSLMPKVLPRPLNKLGNAFARRTVLATFPQWMRALCGTPQHPAVDAVVTALTKPLMRAIAQNPKLQLTLLDKLTKLTTPILGPVLMEVAPENPVVYTPDEARAKFGYDKNPREQYADIVAKRERGENPAPYERNHSDPLKDFKAGV